MNMKKIIKYILILSLILTLNLFINIKVSDNHLNAEASTSGKLFEIGDVLPKTTQLRIHFNAASGYEISLGSDLKSDNNNYQFIDAYGDYFYFNSSPRIDIYNREDFYFVSPFNATNHNYIDIDISSWTLSKRTISNVGACVFSWEDLNPAPTGFTITFNSNGGSSVSSIQNATELPDPLPTPTKDGYTFLGWYYDPSIPDPASPLDPLYSDVTLYAYWRLNTYTVTFNSNGGSSIPPIEDVSYLPSTWTSNYFPTRLGYYFSGWYMDSALTEPAIPGELLTANTILYAKWTKEYYTITYNSNGGSAVAPVEEVIYIPTELPTPTKDGYLFLGWFTDTTLKIPVVPETEIFENTTLYAKWQAHNITISFVTNGGNAIPTINRVYEIPDNLPIPERNNDVFIGWYYNEELSESVEIGDILLDNVVLYASWIDYYTFVQYFYGSYNDGYDNGYTDTINDLFDEGYDKGFPIGKEKGYDDGYRDGLMEDHPYEYQEFYQKGFRDARDKYAKKINEYEWESAQIGYENGQKTMNKYSKILIYGVVIVTIAGGVLLYYTLKRRNE